MKIKDLICITIVFMFVGIFGSFGAVAAEKTIKLNYANFFPPTHAHGIAAADWAKEINKRTNGRVEIAYFPGGALGKGPEIYDNVLKGVADIGMSVFGYTKGRFPSMEAVEVVFGYRSAKMATFTINDFYKKFKPKDLDEVKVLYLSAHGPGLLHTSKKPVYKLEDLAGLKIRSTGTNAKMVKYLGGTPVAMPQGDTYEALRKGVVDGTFVPIEALKGWKQGEVIKYTTECYSVGYTQSLFTVMNLKKWNSLPKDIQDIFEQVSEEWIAKTAAVWDAIDEGGREFTLSLGNKIIPLSDKEGARWAKAVEPIADEYIKMAESKGLPGKEYVTEVRTLMKKYSQ